MISQSFASKLLMGGILQVLLLHFKRQFTAIQLQWVFPPIADFERHPILDRENLPRGNIKNPDENTKTRIDE